MTCDLNDALSSLLEGLGALDSDLTPDQNKERDLVFAHPSVKRHKRNPYVAGPGMGGTFSIMFKVANNDSESLGWTDSGFKNLARVRVEPVEFKTRAEAEKTIEREVLDHIRKYRSDQTHLIVGW